MARGGVPSQRRGRSPTRGAPSVRAGADPGEGSSFLDRVADVVRAIPRGELSSYAQVALRAGRPGGARQVARALRGLGGLPWWRVVRSDGTLAEPVREEQAERLAREGVRVRGNRIVG